MTDYVRRKVGEFHEAAGVQRLRKLNRHERIPMLALRAQLLTEEGHELREADEEFRRGRSEETIQHLAKEMADLLYVAAGTAHILATPLVDPRRPSAIIPAFFAEGNVLQANIRVIEALDLVQYQMHIGWDEDDVWAEIDEVGAEIQSLVDRLADMAAAYRIPLLAAFDAVHTSNMSKIDPETGRVLYREDGKVLKGPSFRPADLTFLGMVA